MAWSGKFGDNLVSDALIDAVKEVTSGVQIDSSGTSLSVGDSVRVQEGPHAGSTGTISGFETTGTSEVQLNRGPHVSLYNSTLLNEMSPGPGPPDHGETLDERNQKKSEIGEPDSKELGNTFKGNDEPVIKFDKKKKLKNGEELCINPEIRTEENAPNNSKIIELIRKAMREQREKGSDVSGIISQTPGQEEPIEDALDYEKYNVDNPVVPNDEVDAMLEKGSSFYKEDRAPALTRNAHNAMKAAEEWHDSKHGEGSYKSKSWGTQSTIDADHKKHLKKKKVQKEGNDGYYAVQDAKREHEDKHGKGTWDRLQWGERDTKTHPHMKKMGYSRKGSSSGTYRKVR